MEDNKKLGQEPISQMFNSEGMPTYFNNEPNFAMSKRFYAACVAMQGIISNFPTTPEGVKFELESMSNAYGNIKVGEAIAKEAFMYADELLKQENQ